MKYQSIKIKSQTLILHAYCAVFWKEEAALILSDLHLGKAAHFRKNGIPISSRVHDEDFFHLNYLVDKFLPSKVIIVGDLFHSVYNQDWNVFIDFVRSNRRIDFFLIKGNHDILQEHFYEETLHCFDELEMGPFFFVHSPVSEAVGKYVISGHIHPSISINGKGRQKLTLPCFYFSENYAVLPSFGNFTGNYKISFKFGDLVYLIADDQVVPYKPAFSMK